MLSQAIGGYEILGRIGQGGSAEILLARGAGSTGAEIVVIKRLLPEVADDPTFVRLLRREAKITVELSHPNITRVFGFGEDHGTFYLAVEFVRGWDLAQIMDAAVARSEPFPIELALHIVHELAKGLGYAHERSDSSGNPLGVIHRDVSPSNVLVSSEGVVKLADFGIARAISEARATASTWLRGKVAYMSPEQARAEPIDQRSDLFSLGVVLWELLTLRRAYRGDTDEEILAAAARGAIPAIEKLRPDVPASVRDILRLVLAPARDDRVASAVTLTTMLAAALGPIEERPSAHLLGTFLTRLPLPAPPDRALLDSAVGADVAPLSKPATAAPIVTPSSRRLGRLGRRTWFAFALLSALAIGFAVHWTFQRQRLPPTRLEVRSVPPGATVFVDGIERGRTPFVVEGISPGIIEVRVAIKNREYKRTIDLSKSRDLVIDVDLGHD